jgi:hypothetical protein
MWHLVGQDMHVFNLGNLERYPFRMLHTIQAIPAGFPVKLSWPEKSPPREKDLIEKAKGEFVPQGLPLTPALTTCH